MGVSAAAAALCASPSYFNYSLSITNINTGHCISSTKYNKTVTICYEYWFTDAPDITAIPPSEVEAGLDIWVWKSTSNLKASLPISKPLLIDCPMPICALGISGPYVDLQRYLIYTNFMFALVAAAAPTLRGVSQIYLATTGVSATVNFLTLLNLEGRNIINMDFLLSLMYSVSGVVATLVWLVLHSPRLVVRFRKILSLQVLPLLAPLSYYLIIAFLVEPYDEHPTVLLESETAFRLTSLCYQNSTGSAGLWSGPFRYRIRQASELMFLLSSDYGHGKPAIVFPVPGGPS